MGAIGFGSLGDWWNFPSGVGDGGCGRNRGHRRRHRKPSSSSSGSVNLPQRRVWHPFEFPVKQATVAAFLALSGDTIAQLRNRIADQSQDQLDGSQKESSVWSNHDWLRSLRMVSYGFLLYGPGSYAWYQLLDQYMPEQTFFTISTKVLLNQIVLGPCVIAVIFAWNNFWLGKLSELPQKYQKDALPTLLYGFRFWIPVSILNFGVIPLAARVAFMSTCSIFWNFYLSTTMSR
ncbi:hypothetical protein HPP92_011489 [Vanilla planifolia]|uniref:Protein Mpv17 n=1 Tax=Vanilla planifolia TaxID=51239 RepID=A0A835R0P6_VANPL|nr:hypothetical protein HPP92_011489 [Vanilla planifolia]